MKREGIMMIIMILAVSSVMMAKNYAVVVGINEYRYLEGLKYAEKDADDMERVLSVLGYEVRKLKGKEANLSAIKSEIRDIAEVSKKGDSLLFYFSGHGIGGKAGEKKGIYTYYTHPEEEEPYTQEELIEDIGRFMGTKTLFLDACYQAAGIKDLVKRPAIDTMNSVSDNKIDLFIAASADVALDGEKDEGIENGIATYYFLKGLREKMMDKDNDGIIVIGEVEEYFKHMEKEIDERIAQKPEAHVTFYRIPLFSIEGKEIPAYEKTGKDPLKSMVEVKGRLYTYDATQTDINYNLEVGKYEITNEQYLQFVKSINIHMTGQYNGRQMIYRFGPECNIVYDDVTGEKMVKEGKDKLPVMQVTWWGAAEYCNWLSVREGYPETYDWNGNMLDEEGNITNDVRKVKGYRLLTEEEWEYAACGGQKSRGYQYPGSDFVEEVGVYRENSGNYLNKAGTKKGNELGIYDMGGNVREWTNDLDNGQEHMRVVKGGSWYSREKTELEIDSSEAEHDTLGDTYTGFRICRTEGMIAPEIFAVEVETGAEFDLEGINRLYEGSVMCEDRVFWTKNISDLDILNKYTREHSKFLRFPKLDELIFNHAIYKNGKIRISVSSFDLEKALYVFVAYFGLENFKDIYGNFLNENEYEEPLSFYTSNDIVKMNFLAWQCSETYKEIYKQGFQKFGPDTLNELFYKPWLLNNFDRQKISVLRSYLINNQMDYEWFDERMRKLREYMNIKWSPIGNNPDQTATIEKKDKYRYENCNGSLCGFMLYTDNGNSGYYKVEGVECEENIYFESNEMPKITLDLNHDKKELILKTIDIASIYIFLENEYPVEIEMKMYTDWSNCGAYFYFALYGDVEYYDLSEYPRRLDRKLEPFLMYVYPGTNYSTE